MYSNHRSRRCAAICQLLPTTETNLSGLSVSELLSKLKDEYNGTDGARLRALQRDLKQLVEDEKIVASRQQGEGKTLRYKCVQQEEFVPDNPNLRELNNHLQQLGLSSFIINDILQRVREPDSFLNLPAQQFLTVPDTVLLSSTKKTDKILQDEIIKALRHNLVLKAIYKGVSDPIARERRLHLVGVIRRGAQFYFVAYDEQDLNYNKPPSKLYKFERLEDALALEGNISRPLPKPTLEELALKHRIAEFAYDTKPVFLKLRVWDYVRRLLADNCLSPDQSIKDDPDDAEAAIVTATVIQSGTLFRWLLGFGDKVEVLEPFDLRTVVAWQAAGVTDFYEDIYDEEENEQDE